MHTQSTVSADFFQFKFLTLESFSRRFEAHFPEGKIENVQEEVVGRPNDRFMNLIIPTGMWDKFEDFLVRYIAEEGFGFGEDEEATDPRGIE